MRADRLILDRLSESRSAFGEHYDRAELDALFTRGFREYGIDVKTLDPAEAGRRIAARPIEPRTGRNDRRMDLQPAGPRRSARRPTADASRHHGRSQPVANRRTIRPGGWLPRRAAAARRLDRPGLRSRDQRSASRLRTRTTRGPGPCGRPPSSLEVTQSRGLLDQRRPREPPPQPGSACVEEVIRFATAAVAIRRKSPSGYDPLASALVNSGRLDEALAEYGELIRLYPEGSMARSNFGAMLAMHGELDQAAEQFREAIRLDPENQSRIATFTRCSAVSCWRTATSAPPALKIHELLGLKPDDATIQYQAALLQLAANPDGEVYCKVATAILDRLGGTDDPGVAYDMARAGSLAPGGTDLPKLVALAEKSAAHAPREGWRMYVLGLALYRAGRYEEAIRKLNESREADPNWHATALNWPVLAMAHCRLGHADEATRWLVAGRAAEPTVDRDVVGSVGVSKLILREAQVLVRDSLFPGDPFAR